jgi:hypothetical protein
MHGQPRVAFTRSISHSLHRIPRLCLASLVHSLYWCTVCVGLADPAQPSQSWSEAMISVRTRVVLTPARPRVVRCVCLTCRVDHTQPVGHVLTSAYGFNSTMQEIDTQGIVKRVTSSQLPGDQLQGVKIGIRR